jgi:hypothetical protein
VVINADALNWYIRESIFDHFSPVAILELLKDNKQGGDKLKQLLDQRAAQRLRLDALVDDSYAAFSGHQEAVCQCGRRNYAF